MENIRKREKTLFFLFLKQVVGITVAVLLEMALLMVAFVIGLNTGAILPANYAEEYLMQIEDTIAESNYSLDEIIPDFCEYALFDFSGNYVEGNSDNGDKLAEFLSAGKYQSGYKVIARADGYCVIHYSVEARFANPVLHKMFPHLEVIVIVLFVFFFLLTVIISAMLFGKKLRTKIKPLLDEIKNIKEKELILNSASSDIREFNDVLLALNDMKEALAESLKKEWETERRRKENISALAHDIKTPLTIIKGNVELLKEENNLTTIYGYASVIDENTDRIENYIRLLINETKGIDETKETSLEELIAGIRIQSEMLCNMKRIPIQIKENIPSQKERTVRDSERILRAVLNIVANAVEYTDSKSGICMCLGEEGENIFIKVEDFGKGFSKEALLHATEQFYTEKKERNGAHYGLGLYFSNNVARENGGSLFIENKKENGGAVVTFSFKTK